MGGIKSIDENLKQAYPGTMINELTEVVDPIWKEGTGKNVKERREFARILAETNAQADLKKHSALFRQIKTDGMTAAEREVLQVARDKAHLREYLEQRARPDVIARELFLKMKAPVDPPISWLKDGNHLLLCCVGPESTIRVASFVKTVQSLSNSRLVVLAETIPVDWQEASLSGGPNTFFLQGSPLKVFDLQRANFDMASRILVIQGGGGSKGSSVQYADCDGIFAAKLIENQLSMFSKTQVFLELLVEDNYYLVGSIGFKNISSEDDTSRGDQAGAVYHREALLRQPRYACGRLFVSSMVTSLFVNILFNPSLVGLVNGLIGSRGVQLKILPNWVGIPYVHLLESLVWYHELLPIAISRRVDFERTDLRKNFNPYERPPAQKKSALQDVNEALENRFIITAPNAIEDLLHRDDVVICFLKPPEEEEV